MKNKKIFKVSVIALLFILGVCFGTYGDNFLSEGSNTKDATYSNEICIGRSCQRTVYLSNDQYRMHYLFDGLSFVLILGAVIVGVVAFKKKA